MLVPVFFTVTFAVNPCAQELCTAYVTEQALVPPVTEGEVDGEVDERDADGEADERDADGDTEAEERVAVGEAVAVWLCPPPTGAIRYGPMMFCFWVFTVTQSSETMPPVSPESGFHDQ